ncbi:MAG: glycosyltransferase [Candidatus Velamenicoccus archaeovorus]
MEYGVAVYVRQLTEWAIRAGHDVTVACPRPERGPLAGWVQEVGARHVPLDMARRPAARDLVDLWSIRRLALDHDVLHLHSSKASALGRAAAVTLGRRRPAVVVTPHYWSWLVGGNLAPLYRWIERRLARRCDAIVAVSEGEAATGRAVLGSSAPITLIHNGVDLDRFRPDGPVADRLADTPLIVCVGRLCEQKGQDVAIRALAQMRNEAARLRLVGSDASRGQRDRLGSLASSLGVQDRIEWYGPVDDAAPQFRAADVVIAPSRWEGMSLVFLEAMACGAPMVVSDVSGSEVLDGVGVIVPPDDPARLARELDALVADAPRRAELGRRAREQSRRYDLRVTLQRNLDLWAELTASPAPLGAAADTRMPSSG